MTLKALHRAAILEAFAGLTISAGVGMIHLAAGVIVAGILGGAWTALFVLDVTPGVKR